MRRPLDYADRRVEAVQMFDRTIEQAERVGHWGVASEAWGNKAVALMYLNRMRDSMQASRLAIECGRRAGTERGNLLIDEMTLLGSLRDLGEFDAYLAQAESLPARLREVGYPVWAWNAENDLAICFMWLGRPRTGAADPDGHARRPSADDARGPPVHAGAAAARPAAPDRDGAAAALVRTAHALIESAGGTGRSYVRLKVALELARDDDSEGTFGRVASLEAEAVEREQFMLAMQALLLRTELLTRRGAMRDAARAGHDLLEPLRTRRRAGRRLSAGPLVDRSRGAGVVRSGRCRRGAAARAELDRRGGAAACAGGLQAKLSRAQSGQRACPRRGASASERGALTPQARGGLQALSITLQ